MARSKVNIGGGGGAELTFTAYTPAVTSSVAISSGTPTRSTPTALSVARYALAATSIGDYALFGGGSPSTVDAYNTTLTRSTPTVLSLARFYLSATSIGDYALFGGGYPSATVDAYNTTLTRSTPTALSVGRYDLAATSIGDYALFGGGIPTSATVDAYRPEAIGFYQEMPIGTVFDFGTEITATVKQNFIVTPATGYIKYKKGDL